MGRFINTKQIAPPIDRSVLSILRGGTGSSSREEAANRLGLIRTAVKGIVNGISLLDAEGKLRLEELLVDVPNGLAVLSPALKINLNQVLTNVPNGLLKLDENLSLPNNLGGSAGVSIRGVSRMAAGHTDIFIISNYDAFTTYAITSDTGSVRIEGKLIYYTAPTTLGIAGFTINGKPFRIGVTADFLTTPYILQPVSSSTNQLDRFTAIASDFISSREGDSPILSDWELSESAGFDTLVAFAHLDTNFSTWVVENLAPNTQYYLRVRYHSALLGVSEWSTTSIFRTTPDFSPNAEHSFIRPNESFTADFFGTSIDTNQDGTLCIVGAMDYSEYSYGQGVAYIYQLVGNVWTLRQRLLPIDAAYQDRIGNAVAMSADGNTIAIGAYCSSVDNQFTGAVYVYVLSGSEWVQEAKLVAADRDGYDFFGTDVALSRDGSTLLIGAYNKNVGYTGAGAAYVYARYGTTWEQEAKLIADDRADYDSFGFSVSLSGDGNTAVVSAYNKAGTFSYQGAVYVFQRANTIWTQESKLLSTNPGSDYFGQSVEIHDSGTFIVIGASNDSSHYPNQGVTFIYRYDGSDWIEEARLIAPDGGSYDSAGYAVSCSIDNNWVATSSINKNNGQGGVYLYQQVQGVWQLNSIIQASDPSDQSWFGTAIALSSRGTSILIGAPGKNSNAGGLYWFV